MHYAILGHGLTGKSVEKYLKQAGHKFTIFPDTKNLPDLLEFDEIIISPGISRQSPKVKQAIENNKSVIGDIELFAREINKKNKPIIGITGTNGKSTVRALVQFLLKNYGIKAALGGNFGIPALDLLNSDADVYVLEISSFQLESCKNIKLFSGTCLNLAPDHMDRYENLEDYYNTKLAIYNYSFYKIINNLDNYIKSKIIDNNNIRLFDLNQKHKIKIDANNLKITGEHNLLNIYAALSLIQDLVPIDDKLLSGLYEFCGLEHRVELVKKVNGVTWLNDSKGTNVASTAAAIAGISAKIILIAGGISKNADFTPLAKVCENKVKTAILYGRDAQIIAASLDATCDVILVNDLKEAVYLADKIAEKGEIVLFSPACSSFDMFRDYQERGEIFKKLVNEQKLSII